MPIRMHNWWWIALLVFSASYFSCKETSTEPINSPILGRRNYTWTTDTLMYPVSYQTCMNSIYGTSASNVYTCGHNDLNRGMMYHYDGKKWSSVQLTYSEGGPIQKGINLQAMHGSGANNIWAVGREGFGEPGTHVIIDSSLVIRFDGNQWQACEITPGARGKTLYCVWVLSPTSVWTAGGGGLILHWDGISWMKYEVGKQYFISSIAALSSNEVYAFGHDSDDALPIDSAGSFLFRFDGTNWSKIDSVMRTPGAPVAHMGTSVYVAQGVLYTTSPNLYRRDGTQWIKLLDAEVGHLCQNASNNIVAVGQTAWHYNGVDWKEFIEIRPVLGYDCYTDGNEIFIVGNDGYKTFIRHGK